MGTDMGRERVMVLEVVHDVLLLLTKNKRKMSQKVVCFYVTGLLMC